MTVWPHYLGMSVAAIAAGAMVVPAARRWVAGDVERDWLAGELELDRIDPDGCTVFLKSGDCFRVFRLLGQSYDTKPMAQQDDLLAGRQEWLYRLGDAGCTVRMFGIKRLRDVTQPAVWPSPTLTEIGDAEARAFTQSYSIRWYLTIGSKGGLRKLADATEATISGLGDYHPTLLMRAGEDQACPLTCFLNHLICGELRDDLPSISANLSASLPAADMAFDRNGSIEANLPNRTLHRVIGVRAWPEVVSGELAAAVMALPGEIELTQIARPIGKEMATAQLSRKAQELRYNFLGGETALAEHHSVLELLSENKYTLFSTQAQIVLRADTEARLDELTERAAGLLGKRRVLYTIETGGAPAAWFIRIPGSETLLRPLKLLNRDIAALWPFHHAPTGQHSSPYGKGPVRLFKSETGQSYAFQFHVYDEPQSKGHYLVFAPTGAGKSTLLMHLLGGLAKFDNVRSFVFDSKEGARFMVEAMGGVYQSFDSLRLNPLDVGEDTIANRQRVSLIMKAMLGDLAKAEEAEASIKHALDVLFTLVPPARTFNNIFPVVFPHRSASQKSFAKWVTDAKGNVGHYAHVFNAARDSLNNFFSDHFMVGINMSEILSDPDLGPPVIGHLSEAVLRSARTAGGGFNIFIDEAAKLLHNPGFRDLAKEMFREYRKFDGAVGMAFQDPAALHGLEVAEAVIENASTLIFFPNALATKASFAPFNLNEEQQNFILHGASMGGGRRVLVVKRDAATGFDESVILDIDLAPLGDALRLYRAGPAAVDDLVRLQRNFGGDWIQHV